MDNPAFHAVDPSSTPVVSSLIMAQPRRPHHLPSLHRPHGHYPSGGMAAGRVVGLTGVPSASATPVATSPVSGLYPDPSMPPLYQIGPPQTVLNHSSQGIIHRLGTPTSEPLYSCQAPRGHDHVYQCPGHRGDHMDHRQHQASADYSLGRHDDLEQQGNPSRTTSHLEHRLEYQLDQRPEYHYGGSDYSSTEPIYAQPHLFPNEGTVTPPTLSYSNPRCSLRGSQSHHGTPARFLVRTESGVEANTLPTVSALLTSDRPPRVSSPMDSSATRGTVLSSTAKHMKGGTSVTSSETAKLKREGFISAWKSIGGERSRKRACLLLLGLLCVVMVFLGVIGAILYHTRSLGFLSLLEYHRPPRGNVVNGQFAITNQNFWPELADPLSLEYRTLARSIETELDALFTTSVWGPEYNHSEVLSLSPGSVWVRVRLKLNSNDVNAAQRLGSAFVRGLRHKRGHSFLGEFSVNVSTVKFAEVLVDYPVTPQSIYESTSEALPTEAPPYERPEPHLNVGWGQWEPWSRCEPCFTHYDQVRKRQCRLDNGRGLRINSLEPCLALGSIGPLGGHMETRSCQCPSTTSEDTPSSRASSTTATPQPLLQEEEEENAHQDLEAADEEDDASVCSACGPDQVCVGLQGDLYPSCRAAKDPSDPTGCGGLCALESEVCQALGQRAFQCHSASQCLQDEWRCADGLCIPILKRCDGHMNCYDQSDEMLCQCSAEEFQCGNKTSCLPLQDKCDGKVDCWDGSDEANCTSLEGAASSDTASATAWPIAPMQAMNPLDATGAQEQSSDAGTGFASQPPPSAISGTRVVTTAMNRTAIGLSSLSNRERELLS